MDKDQIKKWFKAKPAWLLSVTVVLIVSLICGLVVLSRKCYAVEVDNRIIAVVKNKLEAEKIINDMVKSREGTLGLKVEIPGNIKYKTVFLSAEKVTPAAVLRVQLESSVKLTVEAYSINIDGRDIAFLKDKSSAETVLNRVKNFFQDNVKDLNSGNAEFLENVKVEAKDIDPANIKDADAVYNDLMTPIEDIRKYKIESGDTISQIAGKFKIKQADIEKANPDINIDKIQIDQEINLSVPKYALNIKTVESRTYEMSVPYEVKYQETDSLYKGETKVKTPGKEGKKVVTAEVVKINGILSEEYIVNEEVTEQPEKKIVLRGIKQRPTTLAYGDFKNPSSRGNGITSRFGQRWGKQHTGIDIGIYSGTSVKASDGGKVIFAGWKGNYGKLVIIDHENGFTTYYGHCSSLKVKAGQRVARGQVIALSGATGNVTGPHLHFEVRKNGVPVNPLKYVNY